MLTELRGIYNNQNLFKLIWSLDPPKKSIAGGFFNEDISRLTDMALNEEDISRRKALFFEIDALISSLQPGTFLFHRKSINAISKRFGTPFPIEMDIRVIHRLRSLSVKR